MSSVTTTEPLISTACWLRVDDDAMTQAGLQKGSQVQLEPTENLIPGQVAALTLRDGRTLVRFVDSTADHIVVRDAIPDSLPETLSRDEVLSFARVTLARTVLTCLLLVCAVLGRALLAGAVT